MYRRGSDRLVIKMNGCVRVLTLNCWNVSEPLAARLALIRAGIAALQPDLVGLPDALRDGRGQIASARLALHAPMEGMFPNDHFGLVADVRGG